MNVGTVLDEKYEVHEEIKRGGFGVIYSGRDLLFGKSVAIKTIDPDLLGEAKYVDMFRAEALNIARLNHHNIVHIYDINRSDDGQFCIIMEYLDGPDLGRLINACRKTNTPLPTHLGVYIVAEACAGLDYAHNRKDHQSGAPLNLVHQDISPGNIVVTRTGEVKVIDFGIANLRQRQPKNKYEVVIQGKAHYLAPEQLNGTDNIDRRADIFALGAVLFEVTTGQRLHKTRNVQEIVQALKAGKLDLSALDSGDIASKLKETILKALAISPDERYPTARHMYTDLMHHLLLTAPAADFMSEVGDFVFKLFPEGVNLQEASEEPDEAAATVPPSVVEGDAAADEEPAGEADQESESAEADAPEETDLRKEEQSDPIELDSPLATQERAAPKEDAGELGVADAPSADTATRAEEGEVATDFAHTEGKNDGDVPSENGVPAATIGDDTSGNGAPATSENAPEEFDAFTEFLDVSDRAILALDGKEKKKKDPEATDGPGGSQEEWFPPISEESHGAAEEAAPEPEETSPPQQAATQPEDSEYEDAEIVEEAPSEVQTSDTFEPEATDAMEAQNAEAESRHGFAVEAILQGDDLEAAFKEPAFEEPELTTYEEPAPAIDPELAEKEAEEPAVHDAEPFPRVESATTFTTFSEEEEEEEDEQKTIIDVVRLSARSHSKGLALTAISLGVVFLLFTVVDTFAHFTSYGTSIYDFIFPPAIKVDSVPPGAVVYIDDKPLEAATPVRIEEISPGVHKLMLSMPRFEPIVKSINVVRKGELQIPGEESRHPSQPYVFRFKTQFEFTSQPSGADIYINGIESNQRTPATIYWEVGEEPLNITMEYSGYPSLEGLSFDTMEGKEYVGDRRFWHVRRADEQKDHFVTEGIFRKNLTINSNPSRAEILLDSGEMPVGITGINGTVMLTPGPHDLTLRKAGYLPRSFSIHIDENAPETVSRDLMRHVRIFARDMASAADVDLGATLVELRYGGQTLGSNARTPASVKLLPYGYTALLRKPGFRDTEVLISPYDRTVVAQMEPLSSQVRIVAVDAISGEPVYGASVEYSSQEDPDGRGRLGATDATGLLSTDVTAGSCEFTVAKYGYELQKKSVRIASGQSNEITFRLVAKR